MHELYNYACDELMELEHKAGEKGLTASEIDYAGKLTDLKKDILKIEKLEDEGYSADYDMPHRMSHRRRRDDMGRYSSRYSRSKSDIVEQLEDMVETAPDEHTRTELKNLIAKMH